MAVVYTEKVLTQAIENYLANHTTLPRSDINVTRAWINEEGALCTTVEVSPGSPVLDALYRQSIR